MSIDTTALLPQVNEHARLITAGEMPPAIAADWLMDQGCDLRDVLRLFAGAPPAYQDGLHQAALVEWLRATEPGTPAPPDPRERGGVVTLIRRYDAVQLVSIEQYREYGFHATNRNTRIGCTGMDSIAADVENRYPNWEDWKHLLRKVREAWILDSQECPTITAAVARARRWIKRQVLALFPEVDLVQVLRVSFDDWRVAEIRKRLSPLGWQSREDMEHQEIVWTLAVANLIPPEPRSEPGDQE